MQTDASLTNQAIPPFKCRPASRVSIWDDTLTRRLVELCVARVCDSKIAPELGVSLGAVTKRTSRVFVPIDGRWLSLRDAFPDRYSRPAPVRAEPPSNLDDGAWWTKARVALLKKLWADGLSASQIATKLGNVTRNAVIGKAHRLCLPGRAPRMPAAKTGDVSQAPRKYRASGSPVHHTTPVPRYIPDLESAPDGLIRVLDLKENMCRWPIGDPFEEGFHFCGRRKSFGVPYCEHHAAIAHNPNSRDRRTQPFLLYARSQGRRAA